MQLVRYNPRRNNLVRPQRNFSNLFDHLFDDFFGPASHLDKTLTGSPVSGFQVDIYEKDNVIVVEAEMAGIAKEDIKLDVKGKLLTLGGERKLEEEIKEEHRYRKERSFGKFERTFSLPYEINADKVAAHYENGILRLEIPKPEEQQAKQIVIN